jgi:hypothetical protein
MSTKAKKTTKTVPANPTLKDVCEAYIASIQRNGRSAGTAASYENDLKVALKHLGAETALHDLTEARVTEFFQSPTVTLKRNGSRKNPISVAKTRRILRLALVWCADAGWIEKAPIPANANAGNAKAEDARATNDAPAPTPAEDAATPAPDETVIDAPAFDHPELAADPAPAAEAKKRGGKKAKQAVA